MRDKLWVQKNLRTASGAYPDINGLSQMHHVHPVIMQAILNRGVKDIHTYLNGGPLYLGIEMKDMTKGVSIIKGCIDRKEPICIIGDYDIDGVNSTYIAMKGLERCGATVSAVIPDRVKDGYGINVNLVDEAYEKSFRTILTVDNGIAALDAIRHAKGLGMTVVVTDHHQIPFSDDNGKRIYLSSQADAIIDPHQQGDRYRFPDICGATVAWKFIQTLYRMYHIPLEEADVFLENLALATIGDVMDLQDENRTLVKKGLTALNYTQSIGLKALIEACGLTGKEISVYDVGFIIGPCLNATGRLDTAQRALDLLCESDPEKAKEKANELVELNTKRQELTQIGLEQAIKIAEQQEEDPVQVIYLPDCHESIAGIVAGKVRERINKPVFVVTGTGGIVKGSGRSVDTYSMYDEMNKVSDVFTKFGGHPLAAGFSLKKEKIDEFRARINAFCPLTEKDLMERVRIDAVLPVEWASEYMVEQISVMAPFGKGNPQPLFAARDVCVLKFSIIGKNQNCVRLSLSCDPSGQYPPVVGMIFGDADGFMEFLRERFTEEDIERCRMGQSNPIHMTIAYDMKINEFRGERTVQAVIKHFRN